jgi:hypothetical protein
MERKFCNVVNPNGTLTGQPILCDKPASHPGGWHSNYLARTSWHEEDRLVTQVQHDTEVVFHLLKDGYHRINEDDPRAFENIETRLQYTLKAVQDLVEMRKQRQVRGAGTADAPPPLMLVEIDHHDGSYSAVPAREDRKLGNWGVAEMSTGLWAEYERFLEQANGWRQLFSAVEDHYWDAWSRATE